MNLIKIKNKIINIINNNKLVSRIVSNISKVCYILGGIIAGVAIAGSVGIVFGGVIGFILGRLFETVIIKRPIL